MNYAPLEMLITCIGAGGCWALWFCCIKEYRVDAFRERLFSIRDKLFYLAAEGRIAFDDPAYVELRALINGMLRFAHRVSLLTLITFVRNPVHKADTTNPYQLWRESLAKLEADTKYELEQLHSELVSAYMKQLFEGSVILFPLAMLLFGFQVRCELKKLFGTRSEGMGLDRAAMVRDLARTLKGGVLESEAYREGKASERLELSLV